MHLISLRSLCALLLLRTCSAHVSTDTNTEEGGNPVHHDSSPTSIGFQKTNSGGSFMKPLVPRRSEEGSKKHEGNLRRVQTPTSSIAGIDLGECEDFAIMVGSTATCAGSFNCDIIGKLGVFPGTSTTGNFASDFVPASVSTSAGCATDGLAAWTAGIARTRVINMAAEMGGKTFTPGVYKQGSAINIALANPKVYLDAGGDETAVFIFVAGSTLTTCANSEIVLLNEAKAENVFWVLGTALTMGADSILKGTVLAGSAITIGTHGKICGRAIAQTAVTCETGCTVGFSTECWNLSKAPSAPPSRDPSAQPSKAPSAQPSKAPSAAPVAEINLGFEKDLQGWTIESVPGKDGGLYGTRCDDDAVEGNCYAYVAATNKIKRSFNIEPNGDFNCISFYYRFDFQDCGYYPDFMTVKVSGQNGVTEFTETVTGEDTEWTLANVEFPVVPNTAMIVDFEGLSQNFRDDAIDSELHLDGFLFIDGPCPIGPPGVMKDTFLD